MAAFNAIIGPIQAVIDDGRDADRAGSRNAIGWLQDSARGNAADDLGRTKGGPSVAGRCSLPGAQSGGFVARSGVAVIHKGENIIPSGGGGDVVLQIDGQTFARIARDQLLKLKGSRVNLGLS